MIDPLPIDSQPNNLSYSVRRYYIDDFFFRRASALKGRVLDLGGTKRLKRGQFNIDRYPLDIVYANLSTRKGVDVCCDAERVPFADGAFDGVVCAEVLEHVRRPVRVLQEAARVLKPGGTLLVTVPFLYRIHGDPDDVGRYTDSFWRMELTDCGFTAIEIERQGLFFSVLADFLKQYVAGPGGAGVAGRLGRLAMPTFQRWALKRDRDGRTRNDPFLSSFTTGFGIAARKGP